MNSLVSSKYASRVLTALAAITCIFLTVGCGTNGSVPPLNGGFSNSSLNGQYVISQTGIGINQSGTSSDPFSETIVFTADGNGNLNVLVDDFNQDGTQFSGSSTGSYSVRKDGTGSLFFNSSSYAITMIDDSHFYVIEQDVFATSSGTGEIQDTSAFTAAPSGKFVFKAHSIDSSSRVGGINIAAGVITGTEDLLNLGFTNTNQSISSTIAMSAPDTTGRGTFTLNDGTSFGYYVTNAGKFHIMSNTGSLEIGQAQAQSSGSFSLATLANGSSYVFGSSGDTSVSGSAAIHSAGVFTTDGSGNITSGTVDFVEDTTVNSDLSVTGIYTLASNGRGTIVLTTDAGPISQIFWMLDANNAYFLADSSLAVEDGTFTLQTGTVSTLSGQSAFVMDGFDTSYKDRSGVFASTTGTNFNWNQAANAYDVNLGGNPSVTGTNGSFTAGSNGRVEVTVNGITNSLVFYLSSPNTGFMVQEDSDIGGSFTQQASQ